jgi:hypothetical protein
VAVVARLAALLTHKPLLPRKPRKPLLLPKPLS